MKKTFSTKQISLIAIFIALTAILSQIAVPLPFSPVPISFGVVAVYFTGAMLLPKEAFWSQFGYLLIGAIGVPVYSGFKGGVGALIGPTGGFLMAYPLVGMITSFSIQKYEKKVKSKIKIQVILFIKMVFAQALLYLGGTLWFAFTTGNTISQTLVITVYPFIIMDIGKIIFVASVAVPLKKKLLQLNLLHDKKRII